MFKLTLKLVLVVALLGGLPVFADLVPTSVINTPLVFDALLTWSAGGTLAANSFITPLGAPWSVSITGIEGGGGLVVSISAHQVGPHGETAPGPTLSASLPGLTPGSGPGFASDSGLHDGPHYDLLTLSVTDLGATSGVHVRAVHVPEPTTADLRAGWLAGLALLLVRRNKAPIAA